MTSHDAEPPKLTVSPQPLAHSRTLYRALKLYNKVPTQLVTYKGEPHGLTKYANRKAKMTWDLAWFERYVLEKKE